MVAALHDIIVMDLSQGLSGPICSMLLGDLGARVIKIEPVGGDWARELEPSQGDESAVFMALNRNKESLAVDVLTPEGREVVQRLARLADVVICDQTAKQAERAGYDYADLSALNPRLIYGLLTPFGEQGPWADHPASELVVQAASGYPRYLGTYGEAPVRIGADVASTMGGVFLLQGLLAALWYRQRYGSGQGVAVSQLGALFAIKTIQITAQYNPDAWEGYHCWGPYDAPDTGWQTKDRPLVFSFGEFTGGGPDKQSQWPAFCHALGLEALLDDPNCDQDGKNSTGLGADAAAYRAIYEAAFQNKTAAELVALIRGLEGAAYPYHTHKTLLADEQTRAMQLLQCTPAGDYCAIKMPWNFSDMPAVRLVAPPTLGNATGKVLAELGYDTEQRTHLYHAGIVAGTDMGTSDAIAPLSIPVDASLVSEPAVSAPASIQYRGGPLDGIRVMDISGMGVGPVTGRFLAELGAEVIKVEPPHGDLALTVPPTQGGTSVLYLAANLCKRGIFLNLKDPHDLDRHGPERIPFVVSFAQRQRSRHAIEVGQYIAVAGRGRRLFNRGQRTQPLGAFERRLDQLRRDHDVAGALDRFRERRVVGFISRVGVEHVERDHFRMRVGESAERLRHQAARPRKTPESFNARLINRHNDDFIRRLHRPLSANESVTRRQIQSRRAPHHSHRRHRRNDDDGDYPHDCAA